MTTDAGPLAQLAAAITDDGAAAHLILAWRKDSGDYRVNLVEIDDELSKQFRNFARSTASQLAERGEITYDPDWPLQEAEYFALAQDVRPAASLFDSLADFQNLDAFHRRQLTKPRLYVVAVQVDGEAAFFGRRMAF